MRTALPRAVYVCENAKCEWAGKERFVFPTRIGNGMIDWPGAFCLCNPTIEMRRTRTEVGTDG